MKNYEVLAMNMDIENLVLAAYPIEEYAPLNLDEIFTELDEKILGEWELGVLDSCTMSEYNEDSYLDYLYENYEFSHEEKQLTLLNYCLEGSIYKLILKHLEEMWEEEEAFYEESLELQESWALEKEELESWYDRQRM